MRLMALLSTLAVATTGLAAQQQKPAGVFAPARQLLLVVTPNATAVDGKLQRYQRSKFNQPWQPVGDSIPVVVGRSGLAWGSGLLTAPNPTDSIKKEGDGKSPEGVFALGTSFGYSDKKLTGAKLPYLTLTPSIECVDDTASQHYNRILDRTTLMPDWNSSEHMRNTGESYRWGIVVDHNHIAAPASGAKPVSGGGSCIFLHIWRGPGHGTAGCTAMAQPGIESLLTWLDPKRHPLLVQLTADDYARLYQQWSLPAVVNLSVH